MSSLDFFLEFLFNHRNDERINIVKKMKYGFRHYHITFEVDEDPNATNHYRNSDVEITIDNRNQCIEVIQIRGNQLVVEDSDLVSKWTKILEDYLNENIDQKVTDLFENALNSCYNKNLHREYQMNKIFTEKND